MLSLPLRLFSLTCSPEGLVEGCGRPCNATLSPCNMGRDGRAAHAPRLFPSDAGINFGEVATKQMGRNQHPPGMLLGRTRTCSSVSLALDKPVRRDIKYDVHEEEEVGDSQLREAAERTDGQLPTQKERSPTFEFPYFQNDRYRVADRRPLTDDKLTDGMSQRGPQGDFVEEEARLRRSRQTVDCDIAQIQALVRRIYAEQDPSWMPMIDTFFQKYEGLERELYSRICRKYGVEPDLAYVPEDETGEVPSAWETTQLAASASQCREELVAVGQ